jgi:protein SCO1
MVDRRHSARVLLVLSTMVSLLIFALGSGPVGALSASAGAQVKRPVPASIEDIALTNQLNQPVSLATWAGKTVVVVPFLTLCSDICPLTTGILYQVQRALEKDHVSSQVQIVELTVDPGRDDPARLAAYANLTGASWQLVTESPTDLATIAKFFGFEYEKVPEDNPPDIDWLTGKPLTYDIDHSDGFVVIDPKGVERFVNGAAPDYKGKLNPKLEHFLSPLGHQHQDHPAKPSYTAATILGALGLSLHRNLAAAG